MGRPALTPARATQTQALWLAWGLNPLRLSLGVRGSRVEVVCKALGTCRLIPAHLPLLLLEKPPASQALLSPRAGSGLVGSSM